MAPDTGNTGTFTMIPKSYGYIRRTSIPINDSTTTTDDMSPTHVVVITSMYVKNDYQTSATSVTISKSTDYPNRCICHRSIGSYLDVNPSTPEFDIVVKPRTAFFPQSPRVFGTPRPKSVHTLNKYEIKWLKHTGLPKYAQTKRRYAQQKKLLRNKRSSHNSQEGLCLIKKSMKIL
jgi:hypothetical protein